MSHTGVLYSIVKYQHVFSEYSNQSINQSIHRLLVSSCLQFMGNCMVTRNIIPVYIGKNIAKLFCNSHNSCSYIHAMLATPHPVLHGYKFSLSCILKYQINCAIQPAEIVLPYSYWVYI